MRSLAVRDVGDMGDSGNTGDARTREEGTGSGTIVGGCDDWVLNDGENMEAGWGVVLYESYGRRNKVYDGDGAARDVRRR